MNRFDWFDTDHVITLRCGSSISQCRCNITHLNGATHANMCPLSSGSAKKSALTSLKRPDSLFFA